MNNPWVVLAVTLGLIAVSAFFVAVEFALLTARRHRLQDAAATSGPARAALRSTTELSVLLAGSQLGITACTLALGATTKPAVHYWLTPLIHSIGAPLWVADAGGFVLALAIVTFLHLVIGEMMPKSWAIAHPERAAIILAIPMRAFMALTRPLLNALNCAANWCVRKVGVDPVDELGEGQDSETLRQLRRAFGGNRDTRSAELSQPRNRAGVGEADGRRHRLALSAIEHRDGRGRCRGDPDDVPADRAPTDTRPGRRRGSRGGARPRQPARGTRRHCRRPHAAVLWLPANTPVYRALHLMRQTRNHLAIVIDDGEFAGLITLTDVMQRLLGGAQSAA